MPGSSDWICSNESTYSISISTTVTIQGGNLSLGALDITSGGLTVTDNSDQTTIQSLNISGGMLNGGNILLTGSGANQSSWTNGTIEGSGQLTVASDGQLAMTGPYEGPLIDEVSIVIDGTVTEATTVYEGSLQVINCGTGLDGSVTVAAGGSFDLTGDDSSTPSISYDESRSDAYCTGEAPGSITVQSGGTLEKTGGTNTSTVEGLPTTVDGTLANTTSGSLEVTDLILGPGAQLSGNVLPTGTSATVSGSVTIPSGQTWDDNGATLTVNGSLTIQGTLDWTNGTIEGSGQLTVASDGQLAMTPPYEAPLVDEAPIVVEGTLSEAVTNFEGNLQLLNCGSGTDGSITVAAGGSFDLTTDDSTSPSITYNLGRSDVTCAGGGGTPGSITIQPSGTLEKTGGTDTSTIDQVETSVQGTASVDTGTLDVTQLTNLAGSTLAGGSFIVDAPGQLQLPGDITSNESSVTLSGSGAEILDQSGSNAVAGLTSSSTQLNVENSASVSVGGLSNTGTLEGTGTVSTSGTLANTGLLQPGGLSGPGTLQVDGAYDQAASGAMALDIDGTSPGQFDQLSASGDVELGGLLRVTTGYTPSLGDSVPILNAANVSGQFSVIDAPGMPSGLTWQPSYSSPTEVVLQVVTAASDLPTVTGVDPVSGPATGGTTVTVSGSGFSGTPQVYFDGVPSTQVTVTSPSKLTAVSPPGSGLADVQVVTSSGDSLATTSDQFAYQPVVSGVSPSAGSDAGGNLVTIDGAGFADSTQVEFGQATASNLIVEGPGQVQATAPFGVGTVDVEVTSPEGTSTANSSDKYTYTPLLFTSDPANQDSAGRTTAVWPELLPQPGVGNDSDESSAFNFAGVSFTLNYTAGEHIYVSSDSAGSQPFCVDGSWEIDVSGPTTTSLSGTGSVSGTTCTPSTTGVVDLASLGLPSGTYGIQMVLSAPTSGDSYGSSDVYVVAPSTSPQPTNFSEVPGIGIPKVAVLQGSVSLQVGQSGSLPVQVAYAPAPLTGLAVATSYDQAGIAVTGYSPRSGWSAGGAHLASFLETGSAISTNATAFGISVSCNEAGTWPISLSGNYFEYFETTTLAWVNTQAVTGSPSVTCTAPPPSSTPSPTGVSIDPQTGDLSVAITGSGLTSASSAELVDAAGSVVAESTSVSADPSGGTIIAHYPPVPPGLYDEDVYDSSDTIIAKTTGQALTVEPALPVFDISPEDSVSNVPGIPTTHIWSIANNGSLNGVAILVFSFPSYISPEPAFDASSAPPGSELLLHGLTSEAWQEYVAVPVAAGSTANIAWTTTVPPSAVFGNPPQVSFGASTPFNADLSGEVTPQQWATLAQDSPSQIVDSAYGLGLSDFTMAVKSLLMLTS
ncbi:MAG TPA: IPT/TIG domain-containing protein, partial [Acidimicrobiales bacterium]|nr:IPT/TIG domain-containing protein [Acidimicrobiales bacterium]